MVTCNKCKKTPGQKTSFEVTRYALVDVGSGFSDPTSIGSEWKFDSVSAARQKMVRFSGKMLVTIRESRKL